MDFICGIDEAGRGPVIGPMVMAGVLVDEHQQELLKSLGVRDSKQLLPKKREELAKQIKNIVKKYKVIIIPPVEIDEAVEGINLNMLEVHKTAEIINFLKPSTAYLDCPSTNIRKYTQEVQKYLSSKAVKIIAEHKADQNYISVSAASIIAKVIRDKEIATIQKSIKEDIGSGYPSDPITQIFLTKYHKKYPHIIRKSWATYKVLVAGRSQKTIGDF
jgi:ribonuclease HII